VRDSIHDEIRAILAEMFEAEPETINDDDHLVEKLGADSLVALELVTKLEQRYDIKIESEDFPKMTTLDSTVELVKHLMKS
jgi:acyl carrier protein